MQKAANDNVAAPTPKRRNNRHGRRVIKHMLRMLARLSGFVLNRCRGLNELVGGGTFESFPVS